MSWRHTHDRPCIDCGEYHICGAEAIRCDWERGLPSASLSPVEQERIARDYRRGA